MALSATTLMAGVAAWLGGPASLSAAEVDPVALVWIAPAGCPSSDAVHDQIEKALGVSVKELAPVAAVVTVSPAVGSWQASLTLHSHGQRSVRAYDAETCDALADATALIVALAAEGQDPAPSGRASPESLAAERAGGGKAAVSAGAPPVWTGSSTAVQVSATFDDGTMPYSFAPGIELGAGRAWDASFWRLRLLGGASYYFTQTGGGGMNDGYLGTYRFVSLAARACATAVLGPFEVGPCVGGEFAYMHGDDVGGTNVGDSQYWLSPLGGMTAAVAVGPRLSLVARSEVVFPTTFRTFMGASPGGYNPVYTVPAHAIRVAAGLEVRFH